MQLLLLETNTRFCSQTLTPTLELHRTSGVLAYNPGMLANPNP